MTSAASTLCAIEARAERAIVHELRLMMLDVLSLRTQLVLEDRTRADTLLLKLDHLERQQVHGSRPCAAPLSPASSIHKVFFHGQAHGELVDAVTVGSFEAAVQLVRDRLPLQAVHLVAARWHGTHANMEIRTPCGTVVARVKSVDNPEIAVRPLVAAACTALRSGDSAPIAQLFCAGPDTD